MSEITRRDWLAVAGASYLSGSLDLEAAHTKACLALTVLDDHFAEAEISGRHWIVEAHPTIADIACFPEVALADEAGVRLLPYPAVCRWVDRVKRLLSREVKFTVSGMQAKTFSSVKDGRIRRITLNIFSRRYTNP